MWLLLPLHLMKHQRSKQLNLLLIIDIEGSLYICWFYMYLFSFRNFTRSILQSLGSEKISLLAFRGSWAFVHHFKTHTNYKFEEVIIIVSSFSLLLFVLIQTRKWVSRISPVYSKDWFMRNINYVSFIFLVSLGLVSTVEIFFSILEVQLYKIWNIATFGYLSDKRALKVLALMKRFVINPCCSIIFDAFAIINHISSTDCN
jgi:hypothetical protein